MPKNPEGGPIGPPDATPPGADIGTGGTERRTPSRGANEPRTPQLGEARVQGAAPRAEEEAAPPQAGGGRAIGERKKQFLIAPRQAGGLGPMNVGPMGIGPMGLGLAPLSLSAVEDVLKSNPDIDIVDKVGPKSKVGPMAADMLAAGPMAAGMGIDMGGGQPVLVARMTDQRAAMLHQQGQGRLLLERDQYLGLMDPQPSFVTNVAPHSGPALTTVIAVLGKDGAPIADAEVSLFGSMRPASAITDASGQVTLTLFGETEASIRGIYVKPKSDYWSFYQRDPDVSSDELNVVALRALSDWPTLPGFPRQQTVGWGQKAMRLDQLPPGYRGQGIRIAVIDSGIANGHEELNRVRAGFDIVNKRNSPDTWNEDALGHGSHCAGIIGAADLSVGIRGFAPDAELHACKLFPGGQVSQLIDALEYCIENQIDVVNLSLGGAEVSEQLEQQIQRAKRAGVACIVAAGNSGGPVQYPASSPNVLAVAAIGKLDEFPPDSYHAQTLTQNVDANGFFSASFSCVGPQIGVCGPGVAITSTVPPNNYAAWDGTSMAAPHITGLAALVLAHHPEFQNMFTLRNAERVERLFQLIRMSARRVSLGDASRIGLGLPDAVVAVGLQPAMGMQTGMGAFMGPGSQDQGISVLGAMIPMQQQFALRGMPFGGGMPSPSFGDYKLMGW